MEYYSIITSLKKLDMDNIFEYKPIIYNNKEIFYLTAIKHNYVFGNIGLIEHINTNINQTNINVIYVYININTSLVQNNLPLLLKFIKNIYDSKINIISSHFEYSVGSSGYNKNILLN